MTLTSRPLDWSVHDDPPPYFCSTCWRDFADNIIDAATLLHSIEHPLRFFTSWSCSRCAAPDFYDDVPLERDKHAALLDIKAHLAQWSVSQGITSAAEYEEWKRRDEF